MRIKFLLKFVLFLIFTMNLFNSLAYAQLTLLPGNTNFIVVSMRLNLVDQDYTRSKQYIGILGDKNRVDIFWDVKYEPELTDPNFINVNVTCWMNCNATNGSDIHICSQLQSCNYLGRTGFGSCSINNPNFNYSSINIILCKFSNPSFPDFEFVLPDLSYPRRVFYPIRYLVSSVGGVYTVGSMISLPISFLPYSLHKSNYTAYVYVKPENQDEIFVDNSHNTTKVLEYGQIDTVYPKLAFLIQKDSVIFYINTTASELPTFSSVSDCPDPQIIIGRSATKNLIDGNCIYSFEVVSGATYLSMPEYSILYLLVILFTSIVIFYFELKFR